MSRLRMMGGRPAPAPPPAEADTTLTLYTHLRTPLASSISDVSTAMTTFLGQVADGNSVTATLSGDSASSFDMSLGELYTEGTNVVGAPAAAYDGTEGSGFDGSPPTAETRTTAKPICRLLTVWRQAFTDKIVLMIAAEAKGGIDHVDVMVEGTTLTLTERSLYHYLDVNDRPKWFYGYIAELDASNYTSFATDETRGVQVYIRATATDETMQSQLIGDADNKYEQFVFFPVEQIHDYLIEVDPDAEANTEPAGTYPSAHAVVTRLDDAIKYAGGASITTIGTPGVTMRRPLIKVKKTHSCDYVSAASSTSNGRGFCTVVCDEGVEVDIGRDAYDSSKLSLKLGFNGVEFRGRGVRINSTNICAISYDSVSTGWRHWMNGCRASADFDFSQYVDDGGRARNQQNGQAGLTPATHFQTDCDLYYTTSFSGFVARGNIRRDMISDFHSHTKAIWGERIYGASTAPWRESLAAFSITYSGAGSNPTYQKTGQNGNPGSTVKLSVDGSVVKTYELDTYSRAYDLVDQINADLAPDWTAESLVTPDDRVTDRHLAYLGLGTVALTTGVARTFTTFVDVHMDLLQFFGGVDNVYLGKLAIFDTHGLQGYFQDAAGQDTIQDDVFIDNAPGVLSQIGKAGTGSNITFSHVINRGISDIGNKVIFQNSDDVWDDYCEFSNAYFNEFQWWTGGNASPVFTDCHFANGYTDTGSQVSVNVTSGGSLATNFPKIANLDPQPAGTLAETTVEGDYSAFDALGVKRGTSLIKGPKVLGLTNGSTLTKTEAAQLALIPRDNTTGTAVAVLTLTGKDTAGDTGNDVTLTLQLDVADPGLAA